MPIHSSTSHNGAIAVPGLADGGELALTGEQASVVTSTQNDFALTAGTTILRWNGGSNATFTGFAGGYPGRTVLIVNAHAANSITVNNENAGSIAANRLTLLNNTSQTVGAGGGCLLRYDGTNSRWQMLAINTNQFNATLTASGNITYNLSLSPASLAATNNDWAPTSAYRYRIAAAQVSTITGLATGVSAGRLGWLQNISAFNIVIQNEGAGSTAANRFTCPRGVDLVIPPGGGAHITYDTTSRWIVFGDASCWSQGASTLSGDLISPPMVASRYYFVPNGSNTTGTLVNQTLRTAPFYLPNAITITRIGAEITIVGEAGSKVRLGIYADDGTGRPGVLLVDAGQIAGDSATVQEITGLSLTIGPGWYHVAQCVQSAPTTQPTMRINNGFMGVSAGETFGMPSAGTGSGGMAQTGVSGALPNPMVPTGHSGTAIRTFIKT